MKTINIKKIIYWIPILGVFVIIMDLFRMPFDILIKKKTYGLRKYIFMHYEFILMFINLILHMSAIYIFINILI